MKLGDWLATRELSNADFAKRIDRTPEAVRRYVSGERIPDRETMPLIVQATNGQVTANDFFDIEPGAAVEEERPFPGPSGGSPTEAAAA